MYATMTTMKSLCVFCGSSAGRNPAYAEAAGRLGSLMAERDIRLVYGGGRVGLMGVIADAVLAANGTAVGVIPHALQEREVGHDGLTELHVVGSMHERKALMAELADGFLVLPGGIGTLEEFFETWTWALLGIHTKPVGLLNCLGFFDPLIAFLDGVVGELFLNPRHRDMLLVDADPVRLLERLGSQPTPDVRKWIDIAES